MFEPIEALFTWFIVGTSSHSNYQENLEARLQAQMADMLPIKSQIMSLQQIVMRCEIHPFILLHDDNSVEPVLLAC